MRIGLAYSLAPSPSDPPTDGPDDRFEEFDKPETVAAIADVIRGEGHEVILLGDGREFLARILADPPDFVFNIAEGEGVGRCREARVPAVLELLGIPYSGSDPLTLAACLDKDVAKCLLRSRHSERPLSTFPVGIPNSRVLPTAAAPAIRHLELIYSANGPFRQFSPWTKPIALIFKPAFEGSSKGIRNHCVAETLDAAIVLHRELVRAYDQPILVEEYIEGEEVTVGVLGNSGGDRTTGIDVLGIMRINPKHDTDRFIYSLEVKRDWVNRVSYETPAYFSDRERESIELAALGAYLALECRDFARIDFRVRDGVPYFIEANPLPGLAPVTSDLVILAAGYGISHADLIRQILYAALIRVGLA